MLARKRPDIQIVGDDLHPLGKVKDFAPYVAKIKASGADTVITGNWGNDMSLLVKAGKDAGLKVDLYTYYAGGLGAPTAMGEAGVGKVKQITEWHTNVANDKAAKWDADDCKKTPRTTRTSTSCAARPCGTCSPRRSKQAKSADPKAVALRAGGHEATTTELGEVEMRSRDHQLIQPLYISTLVQVRGQGRAEGREDRHGGHRPRLETDARLEAYTSAQPTSCQMKRP